MPFSTQNFSESWGSISSFISGILGVIIGVILTFVFQKKITKQILEGDIIKINTQIQTEFNFKSRQDWIIQVRDIISSLVTETDPANEKGFDRSKVLLLRNQLHLFMDMALSEEKQVLILVNKLYSVINEWHDKLSESQHFDNLEERMELYEKLDYPEKITRIHVEILDKTRDLLISRSNDHY